MSRDKIEQARIKSSENTSIVAVRIDTYSIDRAKQFIGSFLKEKALTLKFIADKDFYSRMIATARGVRLSDGLIFTLINEKEDKSKVHGAFITGADAFIIGREDYELLTSVYTEFSNKLEIGNNVYVEPKLKYIVPEEEDIKKTNEHKQPKQEMVRPADVVTFTRRDLESIISHIENQKIKVKSTITPVVYNLKFVADAELYSAIKRDTEYKEHWLIKTGLIYVVVPEEINGEMKHVGLIVTRAKAIEIKDFDELFAGKYDIKEPGKGVNFFKQIDLSGVYTEAKSMDMTFKYCYILEKVNNIPNTIKAMYNTFAFSGLKEKPILPDSLESIDNLFIGCKSLD